MTGFSPSFSAELGRRGWIGMTWPTHYGGRGRTAIERHVVLEELLAAGAPVAAHWFSDRQAGPQILAFGTEEQRQRYLPAMAKGELFSSVGMSEPDAGSDLASIRTTAQRTRSGWRLSGTKIWTSHAHRAHLMLTLVRTENAANRHAGLSQFLVPLNAAGITIRPIHDANGQHHFNEVHLGDVCLGDEALLGIAGQGWRQVMHELEFERSGPERVLSTVVVLMHVLSAGIDKDRGNCELAGRTLARLRALRRMSYRVASGQLADDAKPLTASLIKRAGTTFEGELIESCRALLAGKSMDPEVRRLLDTALLDRPSHTLRGGTNEVLTNIIARQLTQ
jgi:acyl-CoA dehydrogenase